MWIPIIHMSTRKPISPSQINELLIQLMVASKLLRWCQPWFGGGLLLYPMFLLHLSPLKSPPGAPWGQSQEWSDGLDWKSKALKLLLMHYSLTTKGCVRSLASMEGSVVSRQTWTVTLWNLYWWNQTLVTYLKEISNPNKYYGRKAHNGVRTADMGGIWPAWKERGRR